LVDKVASVTIATDEVTTKVAATTRLMTQVWRGAGCNGRDMIAGGQAQIC
jgi:hypothetical protein